LIAAILEAGGDALVRAGLDRRHWLIGAGAVALALYGIVVNQTSFDFARMMGVYIVVLFLVSQLVAFGAFHQLPDRRLLIGGGLIVIGGIVLAL
jgi:small multidrug resistance family-3 protein